MKKLIILRHGQARTNGHLAPSGRKQMAEVAERISVHVAGDSVQVVSSVTVRAKESALIIAERFQVNTEETELLGDVSGEVLEVEDIFPLIEERQPETDVLILVTHEPFIMRFIFDYYASGRRFNMSAISPVQGQAVLIDQEIRTVQVI